ncbi:UDP-N-acetylglucosamine 2-epimerase [Mesotoga sp. SC_NapDC2]|nr:UDP-N-acetylglucosamine 2-epimerase [Mesotoga sp. SC_NapDC3]PXF33375.1 UDP-N-acetylglucosamine 2-epimerase [Mesotoga sp. SC_NapDC]RIZ60725.1 UDP-N-acetylglucosamine 2-epimerase [Mesotoga sp. SC_NapDC2]
MIITLIGARPQFIKEAIVGSELRKVGIDEVLVNTGQHYDANMSDVFIEGLSIKTPDYNLGVGSGSHTYQTATTMLRLEEVVLKEKPDLIMVYGDTNATIAGALVGSKLKIPIAHVEAGLRQHPKDMPEEINRVVTDHISSFLLCPTEKAVINLEKEGITKGVHFVGDVMYDLFVKMRESLDISKTLANYSLVRENYILATLHRDFNTDDRKRLKNILEAINEVSKKIKVVLPLHPRTRKAISMNGFEDLIKDITILDPLPYSVMMSLLIGSKKVITDSGGLQKEAYFAGVPALVMMPDTGWIELVEAGWNVLVDADKDLIIDKASSHEPPVNAPEDLYGDGRAGEKIAEILVDSGL